MARISFAYQARSPLACQLRFPATLALSAGASPPGEALHPVVLSRRLGRRGFLFVRFRTDTAVKISNT